MKINEIKTKQNESIKKLCIEKGIDHDSLCELLESARTKKFLRRNNYHQQKIDDVIEKNIK